MTERPDQPSDAHESARSLPARTGQRGGQVVTNNRVITLRRGFNQKPSCDASNYGRAGQNKNRQRAMEKNAQNREALQTPSLATGIMDKAARTQAALQTLGLAADLSYNSTLTRIGRITRSMATASGNSACTAGAGVMVNALMSSAIDRNLDTTKKRWPAMKGAIEGGYPARKYFRCQK